MPLKTKPLSKAELAAYEETRDLAEELLQSVREMQAGKVHVVTSPVIEARKRPGSPNRNLLRSWACPSAHFKVGSKAASNRAAPPALCLQSPAPIPKPYWLWHQSSCCGT